MSFNDEPIEMSYEQLEAMMQEAEELQDNDYELRTREDFEAFDFHDACGDR
jgi:hypothetical protein